MTKTDNTKLKLEAWFKKTAHDIEVDITKNQNEKSPLLANQLTARYGFKNAMALTTFLNSFSGKALKSLIMRKIAELEALRQSNRQAALIKQQERTLAMLILGLAYQKEVAAEKRIHIAEQAMIDKQLAEEKESFKHAQESATIYTESATALNHALTEQTKILAELHAEWDVLEDAMKTHEAHDQFLEGLHQEPGRLFDDLSETEASHLTAFKNPALQMLRRDFKKVTQNGKDYLIPANQDIESLSPEAKQQAHHAFKNLTHDIHQTRLDEAAHIEERKNTLIQKSTPTHQNIRALTQQLILIRLAINALKNKPTPSSLNQNNHSALCSSYKLLYREGLSTEKKEPLLTALHEDVDPLDLTVMNRAGGPQLLAELHQFKQGANSSTSAAQTQSKSLLSLLKNAESLAALVSEAPTAKRFHLQEQRHVPKPKQLEPDPKLEEKKQFNPSPFKHRP
jgi:hypothetical protein